MLGRRHGGGGLRIQLVTIQHTDKRHVNRVSAVDAVSVMSADYFFQCSHSQITDIFVKVGGNAWIIRRA